MNVIFADRRSLRAASLPGVCGCAAAAFFVALALSVGTPETSAEAVHIDTQKPAALAASSTDLRGSRSVPTNVTLAASGTDLHGSPSVPTNATGSIAEKSLMTPKSVMQAPQASGLRLVHLTRRHARHPAEDPDAATSGLIRREKKGSTGNAASSRSFYVGVLSAGTPAQKFRVAFDTASGQVFLPSSSCQSQPCIEHFRYAPESSASAVDINADGEPVLATQDNHTLGGVIRRDAISIGLSAMDIGDGQATGDLIRDEICLGGSTDHSDEQRVCAVLGVVAGTELTNTPFRELPQDGIVGLGLAGLSVSPTFNLIGNLAEGPDGLPMKFGFFLGEQIGELALGGHNSERIAGPLTWVQVQRPEDGYWQIHLQAIHIGNHTLGACSAGSCSGIIDSCASGIGVPRTLFSELESALREGSGAAPGNCGGPDLVLELEGGKLLTLHPQDYHRSDSSTSGGSGGGGSSSMACGVLNLSPVDLPESFGESFILGEPLLRRYYTAFEVDPPRVGFGLAAVLPTPGGSAKSVVADWEEAELEVASQAVLAASQVRMREARGFTTFLLQAMAMQGVLMVLLLFATAQLRDAQAPLAMLLSNLGRASSRMGLLPNVHAHLITRLEPHEPKPQADDCTICLGSCEEHEACTEDGTKPPRPHWCRLKCGHIFHEQCISEWLWKSTRCPVCRASAMPNALAAPTEPARIYAPS